MILGPCREIGCSVPSNSNIPSSVVEKESKQAYFVAAGGITRFAPQFSRSRANVMCCCHMMTDFRLSEYSSISYFIPASSKSLKPRIVRPTIATFEKDKDASRMIARHSRNVIEYSRKCKLSLYNHPGHTE